MCKRTNPCDWANGWTEDHQADVCDACLEREFDLLKQSTCADGRCKAGRDCEKHRDQYQEWGLTEFGPVDEKGNLHVSYAAECPYGGEGNGCKCCRGTFHYPEPESVRSRKAGGNASITGFHRGSREDVLARQERRKARQEAKDEHDGIKADDPQFLADLESEFEKLKNEAPNPDDPDALCDALILRIQKRRERLGLSTGTPISLYMGL
jgi:hypothetical protein